MTSTVHDPMTLFATWILILKLPLAHPNTMAKPIISAR